MLKFISTLSFIYLIECHRFVYRPVEITRLFEVFGVNTSTEITYLPEVFTKSLFEMIIYDGVF